MRGGTLQLNSSPPAAPPSPETSPPSKPMTTPGTQLRPPSKPPPGLPKLPPRRNISAPTVSSLPSGTRGSAAPPAIASSPTATPPGGTPVISPIPPPVGSSPARDMAATGPRSRPSDGERRGAAAAFEDLNNVSAIPGQLKTRAARLRESDPVAAARALVELGLFEERVSQDRTAARSAYETARSLVRTLEPALVRVRRLLEGRGEFVQALSILDDEIIVATSEALKADLLAERARLCDALGRMAESRTSFAEALRLVPGHAAALRGLEAVIRREFAQAPDPSLASQLAAHLERLADAYAPGNDRPDGDAHLAAWMHVERAAVLDRNLRQPEVAVRALERAVSFEPSPGPVRDAFYRHLVRHANNRELVEALSVEADHERAEDRASRLFYTAARILVDKLGNPVGGADPAVLATMAVDATRLLTRASTRAPKSTPTGRRIIAELIRLLESMGDTEAASAVRQKRLTLISDPEVLAHEHVRLSEIFDGLGRADQAAYHAERALEIEPEDTSTRERLDRALQRLGRHEERVRAWIAEANATRPTRVRIAALVRASDIAERHLRRRDEAIAHLRSAWAIDPGNTDVFDALSALLAPPARSEESDLRGVRARIELYTQAAQAAADPARKVGMLEKLVSIWEDELGQPARAIEEIEKVLLLVPDRRSAILALQRNAERASDPKQLARALQAEADLTREPVLQRKLLLRAAEIINDRVGDRDRAFSLVERALALDPDSPDALRVRHRLFEKASRYEEARRTLASLISREPDDGARFALWLEIALIDEQRLKRPHDAVSAYGQAALIRPRHPLPAREIVRLLRSEGQPAKLVEALMQLAASAADANQYARYLFQAAEVQEFMLGDDAAALKSLIQADSLGADVERDPALLEAIERIHVRRGAGGELASLYTRWLERQPPPAIDHGLRVALAGVLSDSSPPQAVELLEGLVAVVPTHVPALRMLEQLHRRLGSHQALATVLRAEADVWSSNLARCGALWELISLEEQIGPSTTLDAVARLSESAPRDTAALDAIVRIASRFVTGVNVPHPAAIATRARLLTAIKARRELVQDPVARAIYQVEEALLIETQAAPDDSAAVRSALAAYHSALTLWPESLLAARGLERLAERVGDRASLILSQRVLAKLADSAPDKAAHLVSAAELTSDSTDTMSQSDALVLYEEALRTDADSIPAARSLARMLLVDVPRLVDRLGEALTFATVPEQIVLLGTETGRAILRQRETARTSTDPRSANASPLPADFIDAGIGVAAMRRVLDVIPDDVPSLLLMARLLSTQRVWAEARDILLHTIELAPEGEPRLSAEFMLVDIYEGPLANLPLAQASLQAILALDDKNRRALERLHQVAGARGDRALAIQALTRLAEVAPDATTRVEIDLRLADACREANDPAGRTRALCDAVVTAPSDLRAWTALARLYRVDTTDGAASYAQSLVQLVEMAKERRLPIDHRWLSTLGLLEVTVLVRARDGIAHLQQGAALPGAPPDAKIALGRGLEAAGRNAEAVQVLRDVFVPDPELFARMNDLTVGLAALEAALAKEGRADERATVEEVRACLGDVKPDRLVRLRARRLPEGAPLPGALAGPEIARLLLPEARSPLIEVAVAMAPVAAKVLRFELSSLGVTSRDRIGPRDAHPTRLLADRIARVLGIEAYELYLSPNWQGAARVYPGDPPAIIASTSFPELPEPEQAFAFARLLTRTALGLTWLDELPVDAVDGFLIASVRAVEPAFGTGELSAARDAMAQSFLLNVQRAIGRRQRKQLEEIASSVTSNYDTRTFSIGVRRSEYRLGYILAGDLIAAIDYLRRFDREIARSDGDPRVLLQHPVTNELLRYALTAESFAERRRVGSIVG